MKLGFRDFGKIYFSLENATHNIGFATSPSPTASPINKNELVVRLGRKKFNLTAGSKPLDVGGQAMMTVDSNKPNTIEC